MAAFFDLSSDRYSYTGWNPATQGCKDGYYPADIPESEGFELTYKCLAYPTSPEEFQQDLDAGLIDSDKTAQELYSEWSIAQDKEDSEFFFGIMDSSVVNAFAEFLEDSGIADAARDAKDAMSDALDALAGLSEGAAEAGAALGGVSDVAFQEQCFLLAYINELAAIKKEQDKTGYKALPYTEGNPANASLMLDGDPFGFVNKLTLHSNQRAFFNMETKDISKLQPMIRLFKIIEDAETTEERQQEMSFDSYLTPDDLTMLKDKYNRGVGVGIKSFDFAYEAANPFALKKSISAKLTLFANSFQELLRERIADDGTVYKYIDLALKTGGSETADLALNNNTIDPQKADQVTENLDKLNFRLKAVVGWALPTEGFVSSDLRDAIYDSYITLNLTPTIHEFNLDDQGRVNFAINYLAYVEDFFDQPSFNILGDAHIEQRIVKRKMDIKVANEACDSATISKIKEEAKNQIQDDKMFSYQTLMNNIMAADRMYSVAIPFEQISSFLDAAPFYDFTNFEVSKNIDTGLVEQIVEEGMVNLQTASGAECPEPGMPIEEDPPDVREQDETAKGQAEKHGTDTGVATIDRRGIASSTPIAAGSDSAGVKRE